MHIIDSFTGLPVSRLTHPARLFVGCCILVLAPVLTLGGLN